MFSDKASANPSKPGRSFEIPQWCWRALGIVLLLVGLPLAWRMWFNYQQETTLNVVREILQRMLREPSESRRTTLNEQALKELRNCPYRDGSARLLVFATERSLIPNATLPQEIQWAESLPTIDLCLAAQMYFRTKNLGLADHFVDMALRHTDERAETLRVAIMIRSKLGYEDQVVEYCRELSQRAPDDPQPWFVMAQIQEDRGLWPQAAEALSQLVKHAPDAHIARWRLANAWIETGNPAKAREQVDLLPKDLGRDDGLRALLDARLLYLEGRLEESLKLIEEFREIQVQKDHPSGLLLHGRLLLALRRLDEAVPILERLIEVEPTSHEGHYTLGQVFSSQGKRDIARQHLTIQRQLLDKKVELYTLERTAGRETKNRKVRLELAQKYTEIGLATVAEVWQKAADALEATPE